MLNLKNGSYLPPLAQTAACKWNRGGPRRPPEFIVERRSASNISARRPTSRVPQVSVLRRTSGLGRVQVKASLVFFTVAASVCVRIYGGTVRLPGVFLH